MRDKLQAADEIERLQAELAAERADWIRRCEALIAKAQDRPTRRQQIDAALAAEREQCAKIARQMLDTGEYERSLGQTIAAAIRKGE